MNLQNKVIISFFIICLVVWMIRGFLKGKLNSGQVIFWLILFCGAESIILVPFIFDLLSNVWPGLMPVSWITFIGMLSLILYLLHDAIEINGLKSKTVKLTRYIAVLEKRIREIESQIDAKKGKEISSDP